LHEQGLSSLAPIQAEAGDPWYHFHPRTRKIWVVRLRQIEGRRAENRFCQILDFAVAVISFRSRIDAGGFAAGKPCPDWAISPMIKSFNR
jgi:hypothetical protein